MRTCILASIVLVSACGGSDSAPPAQQGSASAEGARSTVSSLRDVRAAIATGDGSAAAAAVMSFTAAGELVVTPHLAARHAPIGLIPTDLTLKSSRPHFTGSAVCVDSGCTFDNFGDDSEYGSYRINGTIDFAGDQLTFDLTYDVTLEDLVFKWSMDGQLTETDTLIDGEVHNHGDADVVVQDASYHVTWGIDVVYDTVVIDGGGCPIGGTVSATIDYAMSGQYGTSSRTAGSVTFGPTCGQAH